MKFDKIELIFNSKAFFSSRFASLRSAWKGLDQARLHLTLSQHIIFWQNQILCGAIESNVNEFDPIPPRPSEARQSGPRIQGAIVKK